MFHRRKGHNGLFYHLMIFLLARYVHILCATVLVGGTLFYEMIVPPAIDELKVEQQLLILCPGPLAGLSGWVWLSAALIVLKRVVSTYAHWREYNRDRVYENQVANQPTEPMELPRWRGRAVVGRDASCGSWLSSVSLEPDDSGKFHRASRSAGLRLNLVILNAGDVPGDGDAADAIGGAISKSTGQDAGTP